MATKQIKLYHCAFNVMTKQGWIVLSFDDQALDKETLGGLSPEVYNACLSTLENSPVYFDSQGWIKAGYEVPID